MLFIIGSNEYDFRRDGSDVIAISHTDDGTIRYRLTQTGDIYRDGECIRNSIKDRTEAIGKFIGYVIGLQLITQNHFNILTTVVDDLLAGRSIDWLPSCNRYELNSDSLGTGDDFLYLPLTSPTGNIQSYLRTQLGEAPTEGVHNLYTGYKP